MRIATSAVAGAPIVIGGVLLVLRAGSGLPWIAGGVIVSLIVGVLNAWVLLVEIVR